MTNPKNHKKGFTIIELLVTSVVFSIVFGSAIGIFVQAIRLQKYNLSHQQLLSQTSYSVEYISRALRMVQRDDDGDCIASGTGYEIIDGSKIEFKNYKDECQYFYWNKSDNRLYVGGGSFSSDLPLTSDDYEITYLRFYKQGDSVGSQPRATFFIRIQDKYLPDKPEVIIQTTVSLRNLNI